MTNKLYDVYCYIYKLYDINCHIYKLYEYIAIFIHFLW